MMGSAREEGHKEGHEKAREEGRREKAEMLAQLLAKKFGPLAEAQRVRVEGADGATLNRWFEAFLDAVSIDDLLAATRSAPKWARSGIDVHRPVNGNA
jgi:hypothetical protein